MPSDAAADTVSPIPRLPSPGAGRSALAVSIAACTASECEPSSTTSSPSSGNVVVVGSTSGSVVVTSGSVVVVGSISGSVVVTTGSVVVVGSTSGSVVVTSGNVVVEGSTSGSVVVVESPSGIVGRGTSGIVVVVPSEMSGRESVAAATATVPVIIINAAAIAAIFKAPVGRLFNILFLLN